MTVRSKDQITGIFYLIMAAILWGLIGPVSKIVFNSGINPLETAFWRGTLAGTAFLFHWAFVRHPLPYRILDWVGIILFGIFGVALLEGSFVLAVHHGGASLASILLYSAPIWVNLVSFMIFREHISPQRWLALLLSFCGVVGVCTFGSVLKFTADALFWGLLSGLSYAGFYVSGKIFFKRLSPIVVYMISFPVASLAILPIAASQTDGGIAIVLTSLKNYSNAAFWSVMGIGIICTYIPYLLYGAGLRRIDAGKASIITTLEPVVAVLLAGLALGERFSAAGYMFSLLVLLGVTLATIS